MKTEKSNENKFFGIPKSSRLLLLLPTLVSLGVIFAAYMFGKPTEETYGLLWLSYAMIALQIFVIFMKKELHSIVSYIIFIAVPPVSMILLESLIHDPFADMKGKVIFLNILFFYLVSLLLFFITGRTAPSAVFLTVFAAVCGVAEHFVLLFRNSPIYPWDLGSIGIMTTIVDNYELTVTFNMAASVTALMTLLVLGVRFSCRLSVSFGKLIKSLKCRIDIIVRCVAGVLVAAMLGGYVYYVNLDRSYTDFGMYPYLFTPTVVYKRNGFTVAFLSMLRYITISKPEGYTAEAMARMYDEYRHKAAEGGDENEGEVKPNVIVIMNEAFSDLSIYTDFPTNVEYMPFLNSLDENTVKGDLHVSVLGGNTANTEFEFLTGMSMAFLPTGSIPYQQYLKGEFPSLASQMRDVGYETVAIHPYNASGWDRNTVYPSIGFDRSIFKSGLKNLTYLRQYVTDLSVYKYIIRELDKNGEDGAPMFFFNVTMQNHGSYTEAHDNFNHKAVTVPGFEDDKKLTTYLSLVKKSDEAMEYLISYLETYEEPTVVCFFGDHQPAAAVSKKMLKKYGVTVNEENIDELEMRYTVPFYIWANYDIEEKDVEAISVNYLSTLLCETVGVDLTPSQIFLSELYEKYPVITANVFMDDGGVIHPIDFAEGEERLLDYAKMQYHYLFDDGQYSGMYE